MAKIKNEIIISAMPKLNELTEQAEPFILGYWRIIKAEWSRGKIKYTGYGNNWQPDYTSQLELITGDYKLIQLNQQYKTLFSTMRKA